MLLKYLKLNTSDLGEEYFQKLVLLENNANGDPYPSEQLKEVITKKTNSTFVCFDGGNIVGMLTANQNSKKFGGSIYVLLILVLIRIISEKASQLNCLMKLANFIKTLI